MSESKVTAAHLRRAAVVYVRQSTVASFHDGGSSARQYDLVARAVEFGLSRAAVRAIDEDLVSAACHGSVHDVLRFDVAMQEAGAVHRRESCTDIEAHECGFARAKRAAALDDLFERLAAHELGPQADAAVVLLGAVDLDDVLVAQACQPSGFVH